MNAVRPIAPVLVLLLALSLEALAGRVPTRWHLVGWMGRSILWAERRAPRSRRARLAWGLVVALGGAVLWGAAAAIVLRALSVAEAIVLGSTFSIRGLFRAAREVEKAIVLGDPDGARRLLGRHLVSRSTGGLEAGQVRSAIIESVAENLTDSLIAPLFWWLVLGTPAAVAYRFVNTADAMIGYRSPGHEALGKASARLDDLLNWLPARIAGSIVVIGAFLAGADARGAWRTMWRDRGRTESPNAGWTMAAMAGALGVRLEKAGCYALGSGSLPPGEGTVNLALRVASAAAWIAMIGTAVFAALAADVPACSP